MNVSQIAKNKKIKSIMLPLQQPNFLFEFEEKSGLIQ